MSKKFLVLLVLLCGLFLSCVFGENVNATSLAGKFGIRVTSISPSGCSNSHHVDGAEHTVTFNWGAYDGNAIAGKFHCAGGAKGYKACATSGSYKSNSIAKTKKEYKFWNQYYVYIHTDSNHQDLKGYVYLRKKFRVTVKYIGRLKNGNGKVTTTVLGQNSKPVWAGKGTTVSVSGKDKNGYEFVGWSKTKGGTVKNKDKKTEYNIGSVKKSMVIYAIYEKEKTKPSGCTLPDDKSKEECCGGDGFDPCPTSECDLPDISDNMTSYEGKETSTASRVKNTTIGTDWKKSVYAKPTDNIHWRHCYFPGVQKVANEEATVKDSHNKDGTDLAGPDYVYSLIYKKLHELIQPWQNKYDISGNNFSSSKSSASEGDFGVGNDEIKSYDDDTYSVETSKVGLQLTEKIRTGIPIYAWVKHNGAHYWSCWWGVTGQHDECTARDTKDEDEDGDTTECTEYTKVDDYGYTQTCKHTDDYISYGYTSGPAESSADVKVPYNFHNRTETVRNEDEIVYAGDIVDVEFILKNLPKTNEETQGTYATKSDSKYKLRVCYSGGDSGVSYSQNNKYAKNSDTTNIAKFANVNSNGSANIMSLASEDDEFGDDGVGDGNDDDTQLDDDDDDGEDEDYESDEGSDEYDGSDEGDNGGDTGSGSADGDLEDGANVPEGEPISGDYCLESDEMSVFLNTNSEPEGETQHLSESVNVKDVNAGTEMCVQSAVYAQNSGADTNWTNPGGNDEWSYSPTSACFTVAKKPSMQVWGDNLFVSNGISTNTMVKGHIEGVNDYEVLGSYTKHLFGSWAELGVISNGAVNGFASGAATGYEENDNGTLLPSQYGGSINQYAVGGTTDTDFCSRSPLTISNIGCHSGVAGNLLNTTSSNSATYSKEDIIARLIDDNSAEEVSESVSLGGGSKSYYSNNDLEVVGGTLGKQELDVVHAKRDIYLSGEINFSSDSYSKYTDVPKAVIYAEENVYIDCNVEKINAIIIANGDVYTCADASGTVPDVNAEERSNQLIINGAVIANKLHPDRTYGAAPGSNSMVSAEIINFDSTLYLWAGVKEGETTEGSEESGSSTTESSEKDIYGGLETTYMRELAPRR